MIIQQSLSSAGLVPTSALGILSASTPEKELRVTLVIERESIYAGTLAAYAGTVTLHDPASLIEDWLKKKNAVTATVHATFGPDTISFDVIHCAYTLPDDYDFSFTFLTLLQAQRVHPGSLVTIAADTNTALLASTVTAFGSDLNGRPSFIRGNLDPHTVTASVSTVVSIDDLIARANAAGLSTVSYLTIDSGSRQKSLFLTPETQYITIAFRSIFNVLEYMDIPCIVTRRTEVSTQEAEIQGTLTQYSREVNDTYEVASAPLTREEAAAIAQIPQSHQTYIRSGGVDHPILITDHTVEPSTDDTAPVTVKFTYRLTGTRPGLLAGQSPFVEPSRIFTTQYTPPYQ